MQSNSSTLQHETHGFSIRESDFKQHKMLYRYTYFGILVANLSVDRDLPKCLCTCYIFLSLSSYNYLMKNLLRLPYIGTQREYKGRQLCNWCTEVISAHLVRLRRLPYNTLYAPKLDIYILGVPYFHVFQFQFFCPEIVSRCPVAQLKQYYSSTWTIWQDENQRILESSGSFVQVKSREFLQLFLWVLLHWCS